MDLPSHVRKCIWVVPCDEKGLELCHLWPISRCRSKGERRCMFPSNINAVDL